MASVRKREWEYKGETKTAWVVEYTDQAGKRRRFTPKSGLKKDAEKERLRIEVEIEGREHVAASQTIRIADGAKKFLEDCERRRRIGDRMTGETLKNYRTAVNAHIIPAIGNHLISYVAANDIQDFYNNMCDSLSNRSAHTYATVLKVAFDYFCARKWVLRNVCRDKGVRLPRKQSEPRSIPSKDELALMFRIASQPARNERTIVVVNRNAILKLGVFCGLRAGEMAGLIWENVDFESNVIHVKQSYSRYDGIKSPKSRAGKRTVPMTRPVREALIDILRYWHTWEDTQHLAYPPMGIKRRLGAMPPVDMNRERTGYVFRSEYGENRPMRTNSLSRYWEGFMKKAGMGTEVSQRHFRPKYTLHDMRHVAASLFIEAGLPAMNLKAVIGHASVSTTLDVYGHMFPEDTRTAETATTIASTLSHHGTENVSFVKPPRSDKKAPTEIILA